MSQELIYESHKQKKLEAVSEPFMVQGEKMKSMSSLETVPSGNAHHSLIDYAKYYS